MPASDLVLRSLFQSRALGCADAVAYRLGVLDRPLDVDALIDEAARATGLVPPRDTSFVQPLRRLLDACAAEAKLSVVGRGALRWDMIRLIGNRLRMERAEADDPGLLAAPVARPIFITGLPRSGTTFLQRLMTEDPGNAVPRVWQTILPFPRPREAAGAGEGERIRSVSRQLATFRLMAPEFDGLHPIGATSPQECSEITAHAFTSLRFDTTYRVPSYRKWLDEIGHLDAYRFHKRFLQHLAAQREAGRWVLKCPDHVFALDSVRAVYPDAAIVFVHRDPLRVLASNAHLTEVVRRPFTRSVDRVALGRQERARWHQGACQMIDAVQAPGGSAILHVQYRDLTSDPLGVVADLYSRLGLELTGAAERAIAGLVAEQPNGGYGRNRNTLQDYGLDPAEERVRFRGYTDFFEIDTEADERRAPSDDRSRAPIRWVGASARTGGAD